MFNPVIVWLLVILSNSHLISDCYSFCTPNVLGRCAPLSYDISKKSIHHSTYQQYLTRVRSIDSSKDIFSLSESGSETSIDVDGDNEYKQNLVKTLQWVLASLGFAGILGVTKGLTTSVEFVSGYVLEQSLSIDNLFVFIVLFDYFKIPVQRQDRILSYGLNVAIILRGLFISIGFVAINKYKQVLLIFAALLLFSSYKILFSVDDGDDEEDLASNKIVQFAQTFFKTTTEFEGDKFFIEKDNVKLATPLFICLICVELSDVLFALDSVPAVFGVTQDPLVVFTSNMFVFVLSYLRLTI